MSATLRIIVSALLAGSLVFVAAPTGAQTTRTLTVTPNTGLLHGDVVLLEGTGFTPSDTVYFCQGVLAGTPDPSSCGASIGSVSANEAGEFSATYVVQRFITPASVGTTIDCAQSTSCAIGASDFLSATPGFVTTPLTFAPQDALSLTVTPGTGLNDGDVVVVEGSGFLPEQSVRLCQEVDDQVSAFCPTTVDFVPADTEGAFSVQYTVQRFVTALGTGVTTDCAAASSPCSISALGSGTGSALSVVATLTFAPQPPVSVTAFGTVRDPSGAPLAGARVWAYTTSDTWIGSLQAVTDAQGSYEFEEFELGVPYRILFLAPTGSTLVSQWFNSAPTRQLATAITLSDGEFVRADAQLGDGSAISGSVTDAQGAPVEGVAVWAFGTGDTWFGSYVGSTTADGSYLLEGVRSDIFRVRFVPPASTGLAIEWWNDKPTGLTADRFTLAVQTTITDIDAVLQPSP